MRIRISFVAFVSAIVLTATAARADGSYNGYVTRVWFDQAFTNWFFYAVAPFAPAPADCNAGFNVVYTGTFAGSVDAVKAAYATVLSAKLSGSVLRTDYTTRTDGGCQVIRMYSE